MKPIQAIETSYKGYRFRSRLEARWAVFFDAMEITWRYEPEGYHLPDGQMYLPDFWLPQVSMFAEVKPAQFTEDERRRSAQLPFPCLMLDGLPEERGYLDAATLVDFHMDDNMYHLTEQRFFCLGDDEPGDPDGPRAVAVRRALSARFEHGENPV